MLGYQHNSFRIQPAALEQKKSSQIRDERLFDLSSPAIPPWFPLNVDTSVEYGPLTYTRIIDNG
ncbi:MAG: hypothetical protein WBG94_05815 [Anaerolineales bacterium]